MRIAASACIVGLLAFLSAASPSVLQAQAHINATLAEQPLSDARVLLLFPSYETIQDPTIPVASLRPRQKYAMAYHDIFDISLPIESLVYAGANKLMGDPDYGHDAGAFGKLIGYNAGDLASTFFFSDALLSSAFHQDPRYFRKGSGSVRSRIWWALRSQFVAFSDRGTEMPNYSNMLGFGMASALDNAYLPDRDVTFPRTMERLGLKEGLSFGFNILREFGGFTASARRSLSHVAP